MVFGIAGACIVAFSLLFFSYMAGHNRGDKVGKQSMEPRPCPYMGYHRNDLVCFVCQDTGYIQGEK